MKSRHAQAFVLGLGLMLLTSVAAHAAWIPLSSEARSIPTIMALDPDANQVVLEVQVPGFEVETVDARGALFEHAEAAGEGAEPEGHLPAMPQAEHVVADYQTLRLSLKAHPMLSCL